MKAEGSFRILVNGKEVTKKQLENLDISCMHSTIGGGFVNYHSPKNKDTSNNKRHITPSVKKILDSVEEHQAREGGRGSIEFPQMEDYKTTAARVKTTPKDLEKIKQLQSHIMSGNFKQNSLEDILNLISEEKTGIKENSGKLYYELSWEFIEEMAKRMANNKSDKYPPYNWKKDIDVEELKQAINRHHIEVMKGNYKDGGEVLGHIVSYACNSMMLWEQLNKEN